MLKDLHYDYIVIGSGLAGLNCALNLAEKGKTLIVTKKKLADSNTSLAQGGFAAALSRDDSTKKHIEDTWKAGSLHGNQKNIKFIIDHAPSAIRRLAKLGIKFDGPAGNPELNHEAGHSAKRIVHSGDHTGKTIENGLIKKIINHKNIEIIEGALCSRLLVKNKICYGVQILRGRRFSNIYGNKIVLATGGLGQVYAKTTNPKVATGDGIALANEAGCRLKDLEFIQFHPTALKENKSPQFLLSETLRGEGAQLLNSRKQRFMEKIDPRAELAPRDIVSKAVYVEEKSGRVYLDMRMIPKKIFAKKFPGINKKLAGMKIDISKNPVPVTAVAHYSCGGIVTNLNGETSIKNLLAAGEVTCTGLNGANRLASNSLLEAFVMAEQAAKKASAETVKKRPTAPSFPLPSFKKQRSTTRIRKQIQKIMWKDVGIIRSEKNLRTAIKKLKKISSSLPAPTDTQSIITKNILVCAQLIASAAVKRRKSLGCHIIS